MALDELLGMIEPHRRPALRRLVETGEATEEFLEYLESPQCENVLDAALTLQAERLESLHEAIESVSERGDEAAEHDMLRNRVARQLRDAFTAVSTLGTRDQERIFGQALRNLDGEEIDRLTQALETQRYATRRASA